MAETVVGPICEWCGKPLKHTPRQALPADLPKTPQYGQNVMWAFLSFGAGGFTILAAVFFPFMPWRGRGYIVLCGLAFFGVGMDLFRRAKRTKVCEKCGAPIRLIRMIPGELAEDVGNVAYYEYEYQCTRCGRKTTLIDG